jgi:chemotaxis-related protein WspB
MLYLLFSLGPDRYALPATEIVEVLPWVAMKSLPGAPKGVAGLINWRGRLLPVIDLSENTVGEPSVPRISTRVAIVNVAAENGSTRWLGLILEQLSETLRCDPADFQPTTVVQPDTRYLGMVYPGPRGVIQLVEPRKLLTPAQCHALFAETLAL